MQIDHNLNETQLDDIKNSVFNSYLDTFVPLHLEVQQNPLIKPIVKEDVLDDEFIANFGIAEEQLENDMAMCRFLEGEE